MIVLSCLLIIFLFIILSLIGKIKSLQNSLKNTPIVKNIYPQKHITGNHELLSETLSQLFISEISTCPKCSQDVPSNSSIFTESSSSDARSIPSKTMYSSNEWSDLLPRETNI